TLQRAEVSQYWSGKAKQHIADNPEQWLRLIGTKLANFWNAFQYDDLSIIKQLRDQGVVPPGLHFGIVAALGLAGLLPAAWLFASSRWITGAVLLHMAALMPVFVTERYRLAAVPGLLLLAAFGLWFLWENVYRRNWKRVTLSVLLTGAAAWWVSTPRLEPALWSLEHYRAGVRATEAGDLDRAQGNLQTAFAYVPDNADINFALGNLWLKRDDRPRAKFYYRRALQLNPAHGSALNNAGVLAMDEKMWSLAERFFSASVDAEPDSAKTYYLLARVRYEKQDFPGARAAITQALALQPEQSSFIELRDQLDAASGFQAQP
nr:tetratricopeptide repeat protein [Verrucomicrobiota bacterium]